MITNFFAEIGHHRRIRFLHKQHRMRHAGVQRMHRLVVITGRDSFIQRQALRRGQIHRDVRIAHLRTNQPAHRFKAQRTFTANRVLNVTGKTPGTIAAHFRVTPVGVKEIPRPIALALGVLEQH